MPDCNFQKIQDSEINYEISCFFDNQWCIKLGDPLNGYVAQVGADIVTYNSKGKTVIVDPEKDIHVDCFADIEEALISLVLRYYPDSSFAFNYHKEH